MKYKLILILSLLFVSFNSYGAAAANPEKNEQIAKIILDLSAEFDRILYVNHGDEQKLTEIYNEMASYEDFEEVAPLLRELVIEIVNKGVPLDYDIVNEIFLMTKEKNATQEMVASAASRLLDRIDEETDPKEVPEIFSEVL